MSAALSATGRHRLVLADQVVARLRHVALLPDVTLRIIELMRDHDYTHGQLEKIVSTDPALCLRILKVVNSAFYGTAGRIATVQRAVVVLGGPAIRNIAIATSVGAMLRNKAWRGEASPRALWRHSLAVAAGARLAAQSAQTVNTDEAFLAGLLHDIGFVVELNVTHACETALQPDTLLAGLMQDLQTAAPCHEDYGYSLARHWRLPDSIADAIGHHHQPELGSDATRRYCSAVCIGDVLAHRLGAGFVRDTNPANRLQRAQKTLALSDEVMDGIAEQLPAVIEELEASLN